MKQRVEHGALSDHDHQVVQSSLGVRLGKENGARFQAGAPGVEDGGRRVVRAERTRGEDVSRALLLRQAEQRLQSAKLVAAVDGGAHVVALDVDVPAFESGTAGDAGERLHRRRQVRQRNQGDALSRLGPHPEQRAGVQGVVVTLHGFRAYVMEGPKGWL